MYIAERLASRMESLSESATIKMAQMARELKAQGHDVISLSLGEPDFDTPDHIKDAAKQALDDGYTKYTPVPGLPELREAIVKKFKRDNDLDFDVKNIMVSNGAKQCIANLCLALLDPGEQVVIFTPYWVSYFEIVKFAGGIPVALKAGIEDDFKVKPEALAAAINDKTKMVIFSSPCNPTGSVYTKDELTALGAVLAKHDDIYIVSDEIYEYINFTEKHFSIGTIPELKDRVITVNGMAKGFAMTGWRLGYFGAPEFITKACSKIQGQFTSGANAFGQKAAAIALTSDLKPSFEMRDAFLERKKKVIHEIRKINGIECNDPKGAFYIFPDISHFFGKSNGSETIRDSEDFAMLCLKQAHVAIVAGSAFGDENCVRISYAASEDMLMQAIGRIKVFCDGFS